MNEWVLVAGVAVGVVGLVAGGYVALQLLPLRNGLVRAQRAMPDKRLIAALALALVTAITVGQVLTVARGGGSFAAAGEQRYITAPIVYGAFAMIAATTIRQFTRDWPVWVIGLIAITALSTAFSPLAGPRFTASTLVQGLVLFGGAALFAVCGLLNGEWGLPERRQLIRLLLGAGAATGLLGLATGIFSALVIPAAIIMIYLARERVRLWPIWTLIGIVVIVTVLRSNADAVDPSAASTGQLVVACAMLGMAALPLRVRPVLLVGGLVVGAALALTSDVPGLFLGIGDQLQDVTLAQRAYETQRVVRQAADNPVTLLFGAGPGATVDLSRSPDALTLASSGRTITAVPSVHLVTAYFFMKTGLLGLLWLGCYMAAAVWAAVRTLSARRVDLFELVLVTFTMCGIVQAIPAATFLLSNPLPLLLLAIWGAHRRAVERNRFAEPIDSRVPGGERRA